MKLKPLGRSGLKVSALALGTMNFGADWHGIGAIDEKTAAGLLDRALAAGVNLIDTAECYAGALLRRCSASSASAARRCAGQQV